MTTPKLQHELKKKRPFESPEEEAALNIVRTSDQLQIRFARLLREHDLTPSQYNILRILRGEGQPLPILEIASRTITVVPGITGLIDRLVITRVPVLIGAGIPLFGPVPRDIGLRHVETRCYKGGLVQSEYEIGPQN